MTKADYDRLWGTINRAIDEYIAVYGECPSEELIDDLANRLAAEPWRTYA